MGVWYISCSDFTVTMTMCVCVCACACCVRAWGGYMYSPLGGVVTAVTHTGVATTRTKYSAAFLCGRSCENKTATVNSCDTVLDVETHAM